MTADTTGTWTVLDGTGVATLAEITKYGSIITPQFALRTNGAPVEVGNPLPVTDAAAETALTKIATSVFTNLTVPSTIIGDVLLGEYYATAPTLTAGMVAAPALDAAGNLQIRDLATVTIAPSEQSAGALIPAQATPYGARVVDTETLTPSYAAGSIVTIAASASALAQSWIQGSATKTIRIKRIIFTLFAAPTTAEEITIIVARASGATVFAGSLIGTQLISQFDINDPAPTAVAGYNNGGTITAGPTRGANFRSGVSLVGASVAPPGATEWDFTSGSKSIVLRGTSDWLVIYVTNTGSTAGAISYSIDWTEV